jgi:hypothetical protein
VNTPEVAFGAKLNLLTQAMQLLILAKAEMVALIALQVMAVLV